MYTFKSLFAATALAAVTFSGAALAGDMTISQPWARASAGMAKAGAAFMTLHNDTGMDDTLIAAKSDVASRVELHTHLMEGGVMKMREVKGGIPVKNGASQDLKPGSYHVMFMGLKAPFQENSTFPVTLVFEHAGEKSIVVEVKGPGAMSGAMSGDMTPHNMGGMKQMKQMQEMQHSTMPPMK
ncbi:copper chaperone PCu(A)C [Magnetovibrio blakemorei]|uniref:Copper chaperone PCu(A)C n=1 Tax=Magnetovibrio blakemorei TaxID=28181 RepID=A0A1E5Q4Q5_9PROT|nr:copper chaperone PCu(A)C [Magnetovibrio blakemorei]OEJ65103.1 hypothetical protein BEN30_15580 [Magnetovibrio blakemorei]